MATRRTRATSRDSELKAMLESRRREIASELSSRIRDARARSASERDWSDEHDSAESDPQADIDLALMQMKSEILTRIDAALRRLAEKTYGNCLECAAPISKERLHALPFAVRCTACEKAREATAERRQLPDQRRAFGVHDADTRA